MSGYIGLIGYPVGHSVSPYFQQAALDYYKLDIRYEAWETKPEELESTVNGIRQPEKLGANVTVPYKEAVLPLLDEIDDLASSIGAVNTIVKRGGKLVGFNTDAHGFIKALDKAVKHCLEEAGIWNEVKNRLRDPATRLSVGQQQRLCLARAIAVEPEVVLCDEPTSALDPIASQQIEKLLVKLKRDYTVVLVTHTLRQAKRLADYVVFLYFGKVIEQGPADKVFNNPKDPKTKAYVSGDIS